MQYFVITLKRIKFTKEWYYRFHIHPPIARLYQLLLRFIWLRGIMVLHHPLRSTKWGKNMNPTLSKGYVKIVEKTHLSSEEIRERIEQMIGKAPRDIYA